MHECLQYHYMGRDWKNALANLTKKFNTLLLEEREFYGDLPGEVKRMMEAYLYLYREEDEDWEILYVEETFVIDHGDGHEFSFKPDLIVRDHALNQTIVWDHKTTKSIPSAEFRLTDLQSGLYPWGLDVVGIHVDSFGYNYIRTKAPTVPKINKNGAISKRRIDTDYYTLASFLKDYYAEGIWVSGKEFKWPDIPSHWKVQLKTLKEYNTYFKRTRIKKPQVVQDRLVRELDFTTEEIAAYYEMAADNPGEDIWPRTMLLSCDWDCDFYELCLIELMGGDGKFIRKTKYQPSKYLEGRKIG